VKYLLDNNSQVKPDKHPNEDERGGAV